MATINTQGMTPEQKKLVSEMEAQILALESKNSRNVKVSHSEFGKGAVMITGFGRHPISLYSKQWRSLKEQSLVEKAIEYAGSHADELRAASYAAEQCALSGLEFVQGKKNEEFKEKYLGFKVSAMKDKSLTSAKWDN